ncbi:MAG: hypothetical protein K2P51_00405 [Rhabdochlamydiaceae bacterium]|nr:hypothetical protein [Rhabdochlamydiaceae bacterium]
MKLKNIRNLIIIFITALNNASAIKNEKDDYTLYANEIIHSFAKQIKKEFGFNCEASGGSMPYDVEEISIKFSTNRQVSIDEARELEVKITEKLVEFINAHEKIRPFLREYPFPANRADVMIRFYKTKNFNLSNNNVELVFQAKNKIFYQAKKLNNPHLYDTLKEEPYEEALKIVQNKTTP